jgi:cytochrome c553
LPDRRLRSALPTCADCHAPCCPATGLTKVPIDGQPASIVQDLDDMCRQYIKV